MGLSPFAKRGWNILEGNLLHRSRHLTEVRQLGASRTHFANVSLVLDAVSAEVLGVFTLPVRLMTLAFMAGGLVSLRYVA